MNKDSTLSPKDCPITQEFGVRFNAETAHSSLNQVYNSLCIKYEPQSDRSSNDIFYDAKSHFSYQQDPNSRIFKAVRSTADLQSYFPSHHSKGGYNSLGRTLSSSSLSNYGRSKSQLNLSSRQNSYHSIHVSFNRVSSNQRIISTGQTSVVRFKKREIMYSPIKVILNFLSVFAPKVIPKTKKKRTWFYFIFSMLCVLYLRRFHKVRLLMH
jgi:hypothetical protein